jgi:peptidoglycan/LPS O-acetylase OafA/YrhL
MAQKRLFPSLNALRGIAALAVVVGHSWPFFGQQLAPGFYLAVDLFFALSGFVVSHAYGDMLAQGRVREFALTRLIRFYPLYLVGLAVGLILAVTLAAVESPSSLSPIVILVVLILALSFVPSPLGGDIFPLNVPSWSLFYELVVNIAYAVAFPFLSVRAVVGVAGASGLGLALMLLATGDAAQGATLGTAPMGLFRAIFSFSVGVLIYRWRAIGIALSPLSLAGIVAITFLAPVPISLRMWFDLACIFVVFPAVLLSAVASDGGRKYRAFEFLGDASYALYAIHYPVIWLVRGVAEKLQVPMAPTGVSLVILLIVGSYALDRRYDRPARRALQSYFSGGRNTLAIKRAA